MNLTTYRAELAAMVQEFMPDDVVVYDHPAETIVLPAVVLVPSSPWWEPRVIGGTPSTGVRVHFDFQIIVPRGGEMGSAFAELEALMLLVGDAAATAGLLWGGTDQPTPGKVNDIDALMASMGYALTV